MRSMTLLWVPGTPDFQRVLADPSVSSTSMLMALGSVFTTVQILPASCMSSPMSGISWMEPTCLPSLLTSISFFTVNTEQNDLSEDTLSPLSVSRSVPSSIFIRRSEEIMSLTRMA